MSKKLIFSNGTEVNISECYGKNEYVQGSQRDVLDFRFNPSEISLDAVDALFKSSDCMTLIIRESKMVPVTEMEPQLDEAGNPVLDEMENPIMIPVEKEVEKVEEFIYENYGLRVALSKQMFTMATQNGKEDVEQISVKMGQFTYVELQVASLTDTVDILVMENLISE